MTTRASAETISSRRKSIRSPGTSSSAGISHSFPSRNTRETGARLSRRLPIVSSARASAIKPIAPLRPMTPRMIAASRSPPVAIDNTAPPASNAIGRLRNCESNISNCVRPDIGAIALAPVSARRLFASASDNPDGWLLTAPMTLSASMACQEGCAELAGEFGTSAHSADSPKRRVISTRSCPYSNRMSTVPVEVLALTERMPRPARPASIARLTRSLRFSAGTLKRARPGTAVWIGRTASWLKSVHPAWPAAGPDEAGIAWSGPRLLHSPIRSPAYHNSVGAGASSLRRNSCNTPPASSKTNSTPRMSIWFCVQRRSTSSAVWNDCTAAWVTRGCDASPNAASKSMSNRSFLAAASRNSLSGSEKWIRTLAVSGLVSTASIVSHAASLSATVSKKALSRRFSGTLIRNRRGVKWLLRAAGRLGVPRAGLPGMPVVQSHDVFRRNRIWGTSLRGTSHPLFGVVLGTGLGHHIAGELAHLGRPLAAPLVECYPGFEQALGRRPKIALQPRQDQRRHQAARDPGQHRRHDRREAP